VFNLRKEQSLLLSSKDGKHYEFVMMSTLVNQTNGRDLQPQEEVYLDFFQEDQNIVTSISLAM